MRPPVAVPRTFLGSSHLLSIKPLKAVLRAATRPRLQHWIDLDARGSCGGIGAIRHFRFWVVDHRDRLVAGPRISDVPRHGVALPPGKYRAFVSIVDSAGAIDVASGGVNVGPDVRLMECGALMSTWGAITTIDLSTSSDSINLTSVLAEASGATDSTSMWIQAFGATGGYGADDNKLGLDTKGGHPGAGGFAQMVTSLTGFKNTFDTTTVYYYLGDNGSHDGGAGDGGASTLMLRKAWSTALDDVVVIAGSGGGGGVADFSDGHNGGDGGVANSASQSSAMTDKGEDGKGDNGGGGGGGSTGAAGSQQYYKPGKDTAVSTSGVGGYGGLGSKSLRKWTNGSPSAYDGTGQGGVSDEYGGAGGGGYGGGGGAVNGLQQGAGGGGGGSYATGSTITTDTTAASTSTSSGSASGVIRIVFNLAVT